MAAPDFAAHIGATWDHVLIDEYQDTNRLQARILTALKPDGRGLTVVGDDAQSIYAFRAADVRNILDFPDSFTPRAEVIALERNYRSTQTILAAANAVISGAPERHAKELWSDRAGAEKPRLVTVGTEALQARYMVDRILADREAGMRLKVQAVLFRTSSHAAQIEAELTRRNVPYVKFGGLKFLDSAHVKDLLSVLRLARNPRDRVAGFRVLQLMPGVGPTAAGRILDALDLATDPRAAWVDLAPPPRADASWSDFVSAMTTDTPWPAAIGLARAWYDPHLDRIHEDAEARRADLLQLEQIATGYLSAEAFLTELTLDPPDATSDQAGVPLKDEDYLILSTIHSAKGQEWRSVHILNAVDGCIPSDLGTGSTHELEEERRLLYVAMTRAKDQLTLGLPLRFSGREGVVVIGACNHPDRIDPAIRRAGRFDAMVEIGLPEAGDIATILRQHLGHDLSDADLVLLGQLALGKSGADCAAAVRAARGRARHAKRPLVEEDLRTALAPGHLALPPAMRHRAALHEAGHAVVMVALALGRVKALRIGPRGGETLSRWHPTDLTHAEAHRHCVAHLAGRAAELLMLGDVTGGAGGAPNSDLARATSLLLACEVSLGLGDHGHLSVGTQPDPKLILSLPLATRRRLQRRLDRALDDAQEILCRHHLVLEDLARDLEARGFIGETELTARLESLWSGSAATAVTATSR